MDDVHLLTARHFRYELRRGGKIFSSKFGAREVCIAPQAVNVSFQQQFLRNINSNCGKQRHKFNETVP